MPGPLRSPRATRLAVALALAGVLLAVFLVAQGLAGRAGAPLEQPRPPEAPEPEARLQGSGRPSPGPPPARDAAPSALSAAPEVPMPLDGGTRFQGRLSTGTFLLALRSGLEAGDLSPPAVSRLLARAPLVVLPLHDGPALGSATAQTGVRAWLEAMTEPRRDRAAFALHARPEVEDALGRGARLRVWTRGAAFDASILASAEALLERLGRVAGGTDDDGYDVVASPAVGSDVFPWSPTLLVSFAGYYAAVDDLAVIGTGFEPAFLRVLLKHELFHAWHHRHVGAWRLRFLEEGLAEVLSRLEPADAGLVVPPERMRHELALLVQLIDRMERIGISWGPLEPARLLTLPPMGFYALGDLGYLLAAACILVVGGDEVETALKTGHETVLVEAVARIRGADLLAFARAHGADGDALRAVVARDLVGEEVSRASSRRPTEDLAPVLQTLGVRLPRGLEGIDLAVLTRPESDLGVDDPVRVDGVLRAILAADAAAPAVAIDASQALELPFRLAVPRGDGPAGLPNDALDRPTRREFADALLALLERGRPPESVTTAAMREGVATAPWPFPAEGRAWSAAHLAAWRVRSGRSARPLVVLVASRDALRSAVAARLGEILGQEAPGEDDERVTEMLTYVYASTFESKDVRPAAVLVVDLADGQGDALALARGFARVAVGATVACWNPQR